MDRTNVEDWNGQFCDFWLHRKFYSIFMFLYILESLFGCFSDMNTCCYGFWCLPCLFGDNAEKIDGSNCIGMCLAYWCLLGCDLCWIPHLMKRKKLREKFNFKQETAKDCLVTAFCAGCAVCQEARELESRGNSSKFISTNIFFSTCFLCCFRNWAKCGFPGYKSTCRVWTSTG